MPDTSGHVATRRDESHTMSLKELEANIMQAGIVMSRRQIMRHCKAGTFDAQKLPAINAATDLDIYQHPYVKRLEHRVEKLETKYEAQVRRTEEIQLKSQEQLIELQRLTAVGQSQTLADFMLKARDWVFAGKGLEAGQGEGKAGSSH